MTDRAARLRRIVAALAFAGIGTALAVWLMEASARALAQPYGLVPFVTSIVLVMTLPEAAPAQPRAVIGGHVVSSLAGYAMLAAFGSSPWCAAAATGLAASLMLATRTLHPPAGIDPFLIVGDALGPSFLAEIVLPGACLLAIFALVWRRLGIALGRRRQDEPDAGA